LTFVLAPEAVEDVKGLKANVRATVKDALNKHLSTEPAKTSRSRIKRLRGLSKPQYRLRIGNLRVFYDVSVADLRIEILAVVPKSETD
jgi:mRNA interferase RelE/StbE